MERAVLWVGLTGGIASGKSTVARLLREKGFDVIDADQLAREVVRSGTPGFQEVVALFGPDVVQTGLSAGGGELNRGKIGELVFRDPSLRLKLEEIIHPKIRIRTDEIRRELEQKGRKVAFYDVPLLFEKKMKPLFDCVVAVICSPENQLSRLTSRDSLTPEEAKRRIASQMSMEEKAKLADIVITNDGSIADLKTQLQTKLSHL